MNKKILAVGMLALFAENVNAQNYPSPTFGNVTVRPSGGGTLTTARSALSQFFGTSGASAEIQTYGYGNQAGFFGIEANGSPGSLSALQNNNTISVFGGIGYNGSAYNSSANAYISIRAAENWTTGANGTKIVMSTTPVGTATTVTAATLDNTGMTLAGLLTLNQSGTTAPTAASGTALLGVGPASTALRFRGYSFANSAGFSALRSDGTPSAPSALAAGEGIAVLSAAGYGATGYGGVVGNITISAAAGGGTWTDTSQPTEIDFSTTPSGSVAETRAVAIASSGNVAIGQNVTSSSASDLLQLVGGKIYTSGTTPTISGCGTSPAIAGTDVDMKITVGTGAVTGCSVTFGNTGYTQAPRGVQLTPGNATAAAQNVTLAYVSAISATGFTISGAALAGAVYYARAE